MALQCAGNAGKEVIRVLSTFGATIERASVDEAYLDLTKLVDEQVNNNKKEILADDIPNTKIVGHEDSTEDWLKGIHSASDLKTDDIRLAIGAKIVEEMRAEVYKQTQFRCSAGVAHNKVLG